MAIAYLINQYPKVSHSFIRREIAGLEACGVPIERFSVRSSEAELVDAEDKAELQKTRVILKIGIAGLLFHLVRVSLTRPIRWLKALNLAIKLGWKGDRGILYHCVYLAEACVLLNWCQKSNISHIHAHFGTNSTTIAMLCSLLGEYTYSFTVHGPEEFDKPKAIGLPEKISRAAFVVAVSSFGRSQLYRLCNYKEWSKIHVIHCGVDKSFFKQTSIRESTNAQLVCVARLSEQKGQLLLVHAVSQLVAKGFKFKLLLVGDGELRGEIETLIEQYNLKDYIDITGWASGNEVQQHIIDSKVLVLPSFAEGLPVVIMEAFALGRPVISTYIAGIPELVESGINGWLIPSGSIESLQLSLQDALQMPISQIERMGKAGMECVAKKHDAFIEAAKLATLFQTKLQ